MARLSRSTPPPSQLSSRVLREHRRLARARAPPPCHRGQPGCASRLQAVLAGCASTLQPAQPACPRCPLARYLRASAGVQAATGSAATVSSRLAGGSHAASQRRESGVRACGCVCVRACVCALSGAQFCAALAPCPSRRRASAELAWGGNRRTQGLKSGEITYCRHSPPAPAVSRRLYPSNPTPARPLAPRPETQRVYSVKGLG